MQLIDLLRIMTGLIRTSESKLTWNGSFTGETMMSLGLIIQSSNISNENQCVQIRSGILSQEMVPGLLRVGKRFCPKWRSWNISGSLFGNEGKMERAIERLVGVGTEPVCHGEEGAEPKGKTLNGHDRKNKITDPQGVWALPYRRRNRGIYWGIKVLLTTLGDF